MTSHQCKWKLEEICKGSDNIAGESYDIPATHGATGKQQGIFKILYLTNRLEDEKQTQKTPRNCQGYFPMLRYFWLR